MERTFKPGRRLHIGNKIHFSENNYGVIEEKHPDGTMTMRWYGKDSVLSFMQNKEFYSAALHTKF